MATSNSAPFEAQMDLPAPRPPQEVVGAVEAPPVKQQGSEVNPEFVPQAGAAPQTAMPPANGPQVTPVPIPVIPGAPAQSATVTVPTASNNPELAEDVDLIEKEWVEKAKAIVNHTKDDPYRQNQAINKMKADYIKKRYNKDVQVSE